MLTLEHAGRRWRVRTDQGVDLSLPMAAGAPLPEFYVPGTMDSQPLKAGGFHGDTREGGSCNVEQVGFIPHCHGTHTEGIGHITHERAAVHDTVDARPCLAALVTVAADAAGESTDHYHCELDPGEPLVARHSLEAALDSDWQAIDALVIRVRPLARPLPVRDYNQDPLYPLLSVEAMEWLSEQPLRHLLIEMPSLDRADDGGRLGNHRLFWGLPSGFHEVDAADPGRSITEMISVPDEVPDGLYWLHPGYSPLRGDATPSRPLLYPMEPVE